MGGGGWDTLLPGTVVFPPEGTCDQSLGTPPRKNVGPVEVFYDGDGVTLPSPLQCELTKELKTVPSYAVTWLGKSENYKIKVQN